MYAMSYKQGSLTGLTESVTVLGKSLVEASMKMIELCEAHQRLDIINEELNSIYISRGIRYRILGWLFPRSYDFRQDGFVQ